MRSKKNSRRKRFDPCKVVGSYPCPVHPETTAEIWQGAKGAYCGACNDEIFYGSDIGPPERLISDLYGVPLGAVEWWWL